MASYLIQVSGHSIHEHGHRHYIEGAKGDRFSDEPLKHGRYFNASPFWQREGYGRKAAWESISADDTVLLYCTGSVDEHGACLSHLLTVGTVTLDETEGATLEFSEMQELVPKIPHADIQNEIDDGRLSDRMGYCGQEGFNIAEIPGADVIRVRRLTRRLEPYEPLTFRSPPDALSDIADKYLSSSLSTQRDE